MKKLISKPQLFFLGIIPIIFIFGFINKEQSIDLEWKSLRASTPEDFHDSPNTSVPEDKLQTSPANGRLRSFH